MQPTVRIFFDGALAGDLDAFTLNDPLKGQLDNASYPLADDFADVSADVRSVKVRRGRSTETTSVDTGTATVVLDNRTRLYDPTASASVSPYAPSILPRKEITVTINEKAVFAGTVEDWDLQYSPGGDSVTLAKAADGFTLLSQYVLASGAGFTGLSGSVIYDTASVAGWPVARTDLDTGTASVGAHTIGNAQRALPYLQQISNTEQSLLFVGKDGTLTYRDRIAPRRTSLTRFADDGSGIPFGNIQISFGTEFLYTQINVDYPGGEVTALSASPSIANYGLTQYSLDTFLPDATSASVIAAYLAGRYGEPTFRITSVDVEIDSLSAAQKAKILDLELADGIAITFTPNNIGAAIYRELAIDAIEHEIAPSKHIVTLKFFEPFLISRSGSVSGTSSTAGSVTGAVGYFGNTTGSQGTAGTGTGTVGYFGEIAGSQGTSGFILGGEGNVGRVIGTSGTSGTVTGTKTEFGFFTLDTSQLDSGAVLQ